MSFKDELQEAGFQTKKDFAEYVGRSREVVVRWGDNPPTWALRILELKVGVKEDTRALADKYE